ncbi:MAG: indole-3-glycerol-phosphate synthase, partial [Solirubrobacterales bacterium]|nr:indole-3-glycerol-phosphate synthase [Solirubrobacterales bacterium]
MNRLEEIVARTRQEVAHRHAGASLSAPADLPPRRQFGQALEPLSLIAEHKRRSPSAGVIREDLQLEEVVGAYQSGGAAALSILTEGPSFGGSLEDLRAARACSELPILRKDFIVDRSQLGESLQWGADAILLIVAALSPTELKELHDEALSLGLSVLVEVHDEREIEVAHDVGAELIGVNNRDLTTLKVDVGRAFELRG